MSAALVAAVRELTERIARLEKAASQPPRKAYKRSEVAAMFGVDVKTVTGWIDSGRLVALWAGSFYLIPAAELDRFLSVDKAAAVAS